jgi:large subunit ribosomal protein L28
LQPLIPFGSNVAAQHGGLDKYVEKTPAELLGYEGMRIRLMLRDARKEAKDAQARRNPPPEDSLLARRLDLFNQKRMLGARRITDRVRHTLESARMAREEVTKALGLTSLAR